MNDNFTEWLKAEGVRYVNSDTSRDSYNAGWEHGYMSAMRKAREEYESSETTCDGRMLATRASDGSVCIFIPNTSADRLAGSLEDMACMYADETRENWWEADDIARSVAEEFHDLLRG